MIFKTLNTYSGIIRFCRSFFVYKTVFFHFKVDISIGKDFVMICCVSLN